MPRTPNRVNFATPIAHREDDDYAAFANALSPGRRFRQPLQTAPNAADFVPGIEIFLSAAGDVPQIFSWLDGTLTWQAATAAEPGHRLVLETDPLTLEAPGAALSLSSLQMIEGKPIRAVYENVDQDAIRTALEALLTAAYTAAQAIPTQPNRWHPSMRMRVNPGNVRFKDYLDTHAPATTVIQQVVNGFLGGAGAPVVRRLPVLAADAIGRAAAYLTTDPLPAAPAFPLGAPDDAGRARRLTFRVTDAFDQVIDPRYYLHLFMHQSRVPNPPPAGTRPRVVFSMTTVLNAAGTAIAHPLADLYPAELGADAVPPARARVDGAYRWPVGTLASFHRAPPVNPVSQLRWRYQDATAPAAGVLFEAQAHAAGATVPALAATPAATNKVRMLWNGRAAPTPPATEPPARDAHGDVIATLCETFQVPAELVAALVGSESLPDLNERVLRMEPIKYEDRGPVTPANLLAYDETIGTTAAVTGVTLNADGTAALQIQLTNAQRWSANVLSTRDQRIMVGPAGQRERLRIVGNTGSATAVTNYTLTVSDGIQGFATGDQRAGQTRYYAPTRRAGGHAGEAAAQEALPRAGQVNRLVVRARSNNLNGALQVRLVRNGTPTTLLVNLPAGSTTAQTTANAFTVAPGDTLSVEATAGGTTGRIRGLRWEIGYRPANTAQWQHPAWVLEGYGPPGGVPSPWNGAGLVRPGRPMTWAQLEQVVNDVEGQRMSPGLLQTLISTAWGTLPYIDAVAPGIYAALGTARPATRGELLSWLLEGPHSLLCGVAYMRMLYLQYNTRWDLPMVGAAYNAGAPRARPNSRWGLVYYGDYVEHAAPHFNAGSTLFDTAGALNVAPSVRFMR